MTKTGMFIGLLLFTFLLLGSVNAEVFSSDSRGVSKSQFKTDEVVYARITFDTCPGVETANLYIVENDDSWDLGDILFEERDSVQEVQLGKYQIIKVWENPLAGDYDIIVDCVGNGEYHPLNSVDSLSDSGFSVEIETGRGIASLGENDLGDYSWGYDPEEISSLSEVLQVNLKALTEEISLKDLTVTASGEGDDSEIEKIEVYVDENNNGKLDGNDFIIGTSEYEENDGESVIDLDYNLEDSANLIIAYSFPDSIVEGNEFSLMLLSINGIGQDSDKDISFSGLPIESGTITIMPEKTCLGELALYLEPNSVMSSEEVIASFEGLEGCSGFEVQLRPNPCGSQVKDTLCTCNLEEDSCSCIFEATSTMTVYACIDKNDDNDMIDFGEYALEDLVVEQPVIIEENTEIEETTETTESEETTESSETSPITGEFLGGIQGKIVSVDSFLILLEITLLMILFILIMIMFKLRAINIATITQTSTPVKTSKKDSSEKEAEEED